MPLVDLGFGVPVDPSRPVLLAGAPGEPLPDADDVADIVGSLPWESREKFVLIPYGQDPESCAAFAQLLADLTGTIVHAYDALPYYAADGSRQFAVFDETGHPIRLSENPETAYYPAADDSFRPVEDLSLPDLTEEPEAAETVIAPVIVDTLGHLRPAGPPPWRHPTTAHPEPCETKPGTRPPLYAVTSSETLLHPETASAGPPNVHSTSSGQPKRPPGSPGSLTPPAPPKSPTPWAASAASATTTSPAPSGSPTPFTPPAVRIARFVRAARGVRATWVVHAVRIVRAAGSLASSATARVVRGRSASSRSSRVAPSRRVGRPRRPRRSRHLRHPRRLGRPRHPYRPRRLSRLRRPRGAR